MRGTRATFYNNLNNLSKIKLIHLFATGATDKEILRFKLLLTADAAPVAPLAQDPVMSRIIVVAIVTDFKIKFEIFGYLKLTYFDCQAAPCRWDGTWFDPLLACPCTTSE